MRPFSFKSLTHSLIVPDATPYKSAKYAFDAQQYPSFEASAVISPYRSFAFGGIFAYRTFAGMTA